MILKKDGGKSIYNKHKDMATCRRRESMLARFHILLQMHLYTLQMHMMAIIGLGAMSPCNANGNTFCIKM
jgi:hypothetical protein